MKKFFDWFLVEVFRFIAYVSLLYIVLYPMDMGCMLPIWAIIILIVIAILSLVVYNRRVKWFSDKYNVKEEGRSDEKGC